MSEFEVENISSVNGNRGNENNLSIFKPSTLKIGIKVDEENIKQFLLRKVKRHRKMKYSERFPQHAKEFINKFGNVSVNISKKDMESYKFYKRYESHIEAGLV